jgi:hypothetical protein
MRLASPISFLKKKKTLTKKTFCMLPTPTKSELHTQKKNKKKKNKQTNKGSGVQYGHKSGGQGTSGRSWIDRLEPSE